jgi:N-acylneuraminate cytidylyltransferase/CMP-N,N'-diacetyllegionaminic acid synthase
MSNPFETQEKMIAIIPARGGSKGLPGKNIRPLAGKPLIAWTIQAALGARTISRVILSTDSEEIADVGRANGAEIPFMRPSELAQDDSLAIDNYVYTVNRLNKELADSGETRSLQIADFVVLLPTSPLRNSADIDNAVTIFREKNADSVISYYPAPHPIQWHKYMDERGVLRSYFPEGEKLANRQAEKPAYLPNGAVYVFKFSVLSEKRAYYTDRSYPYLMPASRSVDIDTLDDFLMAEFLLGRGERE